MPRVVYCDNKDCIYYDGGCDVDRLVIERGVCMGWIGYGRNTSENDPDVQLKEENAELRELVRDLVRPPATLCFGCKYEKHHDCESGFKCMLVERAKRLGIEVG